MLEVQDTKVIKFITEDKYRYLRHIMLVLGLLGTLSFFKDVTLHQGSYRLLKVMLVFIPLILTCYININILVPNFFFKGKHLLYFFLVLILVIISLSSISKMIDYTYPKEINLNPQEDYNGWEFYESIIILVPVILVTTMIKLFQRWMIDNQRINELNKITYNMELNELRNQINPHFLFNMLNGIKSLVRTDTEKASLVIMKLSEFLRYQIYENNDEHTLLKSEIKFLTNFLELETIRRDNLSAKITCNIDWSSTGSLFIPPNLFTTFVENAVKHSVNIDSEESFVKVVIEVDEKKLYFNCINSKDPNFIPSLKEKSSGLGLGNIKRRLELLYGNNHKLEINSTETKYEIKLELPL